MKRSLSLSGSKPLTRATDVTGQPQIKNKNTSPLRRSASGSFPYPCSFSPSLSAWCCRAAGTARNVRLWIITPFHLMHGVDCETSPLTCGPGMQPSPDTAKRIVAAVGRYAGTVQPRPSLTALTAGAAVAAKKEEARVPSFWRHYRRNPQLLVAACVSCIRDLAWVARLRRGGWRPAAVA